MADAKAVVDEWTGEASLDDMSAEDELAYIDARLEAVRLNGTVSHEVAMQRIDRLMAGLKST